MAVGFRRRSPARAGRLSLPMIRGRHAQESAGRSPGVAGIHFGMRSGSGRSGYVALEPRDLGVYPENPLHELVPLPVGRWGCLPVHETEDALVDARAKKLRRLRGR